MNTDSTFGQIVRERRLANNLTQVELANRVGCATVTIRKIEYDTLRPSVQIAERLAMALNIPLEDRANFVRLARIPLDGTPEPAPIPSPPPMPEEIGQEDLSGRAVKGYKLGERVGNGGFGAVYRATQDVVEREVAVKIILPQYANHPDFIRRFEAEAQIIARIEHPFIVPLYDYWREPSAAYLVMRLLRGGSLEKVLKRGALPLKTAVRYLEQIGTALHSAHRVGIVHRDIKPANILLDNEDNSYLADFGIAKNLGNPNAAEQTAAGMMIGSPAYISPEQILAEPVRPQADIYCLGLLLYEMLTGQKPFNGPTPIEYIQQHLNQKLPPLNGDGGPYPPEFDAIIDRATTKKAAERYPDVLSMLAEIQMAVNRWESGSSAPGFDITELIAAENPYKGLYAFGEGDAENFFGRETMIQELLSRLADSDVPDEGAGQGLSRFLAIVGPSGSGKSSVVRAGLLPALRGGGVPGSENWFIVDMTPGTHPFEEVEAALLRIATNPPDSLLGQLREDARGLLRASKRILPQDGITELLLVIDQFEELFTLVEDEKMRSEFLDSLVNAVIDPRSRMRVIITLRADFIDRPLQYVDFGELVRKRSEFTLPLSPDELEQAITQPLARFRMSVEPELLATIIHEISGQPGGLPLLQYALTELFERREGPLLTLSGYQAIGGVAGALARRADEIYEALPNEEQAATRQLFLRLITLGDGVGENAAVADTRRRVRLSELTDLGNAVAIEQTIERFGRYRLLTFDHHFVTREPTVEVAHEALLREWGRLRVWLDESRDDVRQQRLLAAAAAEWLATNKDHGYLLRGSRLAQFEGWANRSKLALTTDEQAFLTASIAAETERKAKDEARQQRELETAQQLAEEQTRRAEEQTTAAQSLRQRAYFLVGALIVAAVLAAAAFGFARSSTDNANLAATRAAEALLNANSAATSEAEAVMNADVAATREAEAEREREAAEAAEATAQAEAVVRTTAEAIALTEQEESQRQATLATARELAAFGLVSLEEDPERTVLLASRSLELAYTTEGENVLRQGMRASRVRLTIPHTLGALNSVAFTADGSMLVGVEIDGEESFVTYWDIETGEVLHQISCGALCMNGSVNSINRDGTLLATAIESENDTTIYVIDLAESLRVGSVQVKQEMTAQEMPFGQMSFSPDGRQLATVHFEEKSLNVWDLETGSMLFSRTGPLQWTFSTPSYHPDGTLIAVSGFVVNSEVGTQIYDAQSGDLLLELPVHHRAPRFTPDGKRFLTRSVQDLQVYLWDLDNSLATGEAQEIYTFGSIERTFTPNYDVTADGRLLVDSIGQFGDAVIWQLGAEEAIELMLLSGHLPGFSLKLLFHPDSKRLATVGEDGIKIWDVTPTGERELLNFEAHSDRIPYMALNPDNTQLATASWDGTAALWDVETGELLQRFTAESEQPTLHYVDFSPDGTRIVTTGNDRMARVWDVQTGEALATLEVSDEGFDIGAVFTGGVSARFSPDGRLLVTAGVDGTVRLWDAVTYEEIQRYLINPSESAPLGVRGVTLAIFSPDGSMLAAATDGSGEDGIFRVWNIESGEVVLEQTIGMRVFGLDFSPDGNRIAISTCCVGIGQVWNLQTGQLEIDLPLPAITVFKLFFTHNGNQLITPVGDEVWLWDAHTGELLRTLKLDLFWIFLPSADDSKVFTGGIDGNVRAYLTDVDELMALAKSRVTRTLREDECQQYLHMDVCPQE